MMETLNPSEFKKSGVSPINTQKKMFLVLCWTRLGQNISLVLPKKHGWIDKYLYYTYLNFTFCYQTVITDRRPDPKSNRRFSLCSLFQDKSIYMKPPRKLAFPGHNSFYTGQLTRRSPRKCSAFPRSRQSPLINKHKNTRKNINALPGFLCLFNLLVVIAKIIQW